MKYRRKLLLTTAQLASAIGVSPRRIQQLCNEGILTREKHGVFRLGAIRDFIKHRERTITVQLGGGRYADARRQLLHEKVLAARFERKVRENEFVRLSLISDVVTRMLVALKTHALSLPSRLAPRLTAINDPVAIHSLLTAEVRLWLIEASEGRFAQAVARKTGNAEFAADVTNIQDESDAEIHRT